MSWKSVLAVVLLLLPTVLVVLGPVSATPETVPGFPTVQWQNQTGLRTTFYLKYQDAAGSNQPVCVDAPPPGAPADARLAFAPAKGTSGERTRAECTYVAGASAQGTGTQNSVTFSLHTSPDGTNERGVLHPFNITGNTSIFYQHKGAIPEGVDVLVEVKNGDSAIAHKTIHGVSTNQGTIPQDVYTTFLDLKESGDKGEVFQTGKDVRLVLTATPTTPVALPVGSPAAKPAQWNVSDQGSFVQIVSDDAVKAASWTQDEAGVLRTLYRPLAKDATPPNGIPPRLVGAFAVRSAFGYGDSIGSSAQDTSGFSPSFAVENQSGPIAIGPERIRTIDGAINASASNNADGLAVWNFKPGFLDYRGIDAGEYNVTVDMPYHGGSAFRQGIRAPFLITTQSVSLAAFDDNDPSTNPSPLEQLAHDLPAGGSTTYLLLLTNTGPVTDTFRLAASQVSGTPSAWSATIGGPGVLDRAVRVAPGDSTLVTVNVVPPPSAANGATSIIQVNATSSVDPSARTVPVILTSTVSALVRHEVAILGPATTPSLDPTSELRVPVQVWNKGTRPANLSLEVRTVPSGWTAQLAQGDNGVSRLVVPNVQPGDIATADLRIQGPTNTPEGTFSIGLNASDVDVGGVAIDKVVNVALHPLASVRMDILDTVGTHTHDVKVNGGPPLSTDVGGMAGSWFRVWITNTGTRGDTFALTIDSVRTSAPNPNVAPSPAFPTGGCSETVFKSATGRPLGWYFRSDVDEPQGVLSLQIDVGQTAEAYVWVPANPNVDICPDPKTNTDFISFVADAKGTLTQAEARASATVTAVSRDEQSVHLDVVSRGIPDHVYAKDKPLVDITDARHHFVVGGIEPNATQTYRVRLTHAGSYASWSDKNGNRFDSNVVVQLLAVNRETGWNASIRKVLPNTNNDPLLNPFSDKIVFTNQRSGERQSWIDQEIEVRVTSPSAQNGSALAGESNGFTIHAFANESGSDQFDDISVSTVIVDLAKIDVAAENAHALAHPGEAGSFLLYVNNTGSSNATVRLTSAMDAAGTPNPASWNTDPAVQTFTVAAFKNRTLALNVRTPGGASVGTQGVTNVTISYAADPFAPAKLTNKSLSLITEVVARGTLTLTPASTVTQIAPGNFANFTLTLSNTGAQTVPFEVKGTAIYNWTQQVSPSSGSLQPGESRTVVVVLKAPSDVTDGSSFSTVVRATEFGNEVNFDSVPLTVSILGGTAIPSLSVPKTIKTVDRAGVQSFEVNVKNLGSKADKFVLSVRGGEGSIGWQAYVQDQKGNNVSNVTIAPNDLQTVNVTVRPPLSVPEHAIVPFEITAEAPALAAKTTLQAQIHDYGVQLSLNPARIDLVAGLPTEFVLRVTNTGNDNDTLNVSAPLIDTPDWVVQLAVDRVRLEPGQSNDIRAIVRSPTHPLPTAHAYTLKFYGGTLGGQAVNVSKNDSIAAVVNILPYRPVDVDRDDLLELAVDADGNPSNGFERFQEVFTEGVQSVVVSTGKLNGKSNFFLDVPRDGKQYDGIADVWFDPEALYAYDIKYHADINGDNSPDYLLDTDRDGRIDKAYDAVSGSFWNVVEIHAYGDSRVQFLVDSSGADGRPDRFFDPETGRVTRTQSVGDSNLVGLDTQNNGRVDKIYDISGKTVSDAKVYGFVDFTKQYWYFFVGFAVLLVVSIVLLVRRRRAP